MALYWTFKQNFYYNWYVDGGDHLFQRAVLKKHKDLMNGRTEDYILEKKNHYSIFDEYFLITKH